MQTTERTRARVSTVVAALALGALILACAARSSRSDAPPQGWWSARGPVVPHDTFPADCSLCHEGDDWRDIRDDFEFDHGLETGVALEGAHVSAECLRCHNDRGPAAVYARQGCAGCHEDLHRGKLGKNCDSCHDQLDWQPNGQIELHNRTRFPLVGAHAATACWRCHPGAQVGNFDRADIECISCHADDLALATEPDHLAQGWVNACDRCHIPTTWSGAGFNHATWPLTGAHQGALCTACHATGIYRGTPNMCVDCHLGEYQATTNPNHAALNISTRCQDCHGTSTWLGANFNHTGITNNCVTCHLTEYTNTTNPNHASAGFPTSCEACHNTNTWFGANFNHSFPINSGPHKVFDCGDCHLNPSNFTAFSCTHCHEHRQSEMDDKHDEVPGYVWSSPACLACHPNGKER